MRAQVRAVRIEVDEQPLAGRRLRLRVAGQERDERRQRRARAEARQQRATGPSLVAHAQLNNPGSGPVPNWSVPNLSTASPMARHTETSTVLWLMLFLSSLVL